MVWRESNGDRNSDVHTERKIQLVKLGACFTDSDELTGHSQDPFLVERTRIELQLASLREFDSQ